MGTYCGFTCIAHHEQFQLNLKNSLFHKIMKFIALFHALACHFHLTWPGENHTELLIPLFIKVYYAAVLGSIVH